MTSDIFVFYASPEKKEEALSLSMKDSKGTKAVKDGKTIELTEEEQQRPPIKEYIENGKRKEKSKPRLVKITKGDNPLKAKFEKFLETKPTEDKLNDWAAKNLPELDIDPAKLKKTQIIDKIREALK